MLVRSDGHRSVGTGIYLINTRAGVDGHRRDPGGRRGGADVDDADARGAGARSARRRPSGRRTCIGRAGPETTQSRFWSRWTGWVMRRPWVVGAGGVALFLLTLAAPGVLDGARQQHAASVRADPRDPRRCQRSGRGALGAGALGAGARPGDLPRRQRRLGRRKAAVRSMRCASKMAQGTQRRAGGAAGVRRRTTGSALLSAVLSVDPGGHGQPAKPSTGCAQQLPRAAVGQRAHRRRRADGADQGLRRPGLGDAAAGVRVRRADRVRDAADLDPVGVPGASRAS